MAQRAQPHEPVAVEIARRKIMRAVALQQLFDAGGERVFEPEIGQHAAELAEVDAIIAGVLTDLASVDDISGWDQTFDEIGDVAHLEILGIAADIDQLIVDHRAGRIEKCDKGARNVFAVNQRAPRAAVAHDANIASGHGTAEQVVDH